LVDFTLRRDFPEISGTVRQKRAAWFAEVCERTARMVVEWMRVGFVHGVMNTDNMSILGLTIDYGPYGWIDDFDPDWTPNTTDAERRRYRFGAQPADGLLEPAATGAGAVAAVRGCREAGGGLAGVCRGTWIEADRRMIAAKLGLVACRRRRHRADARSAAACCMQARST
jgi:hypothetical protein